MRTKSVRAGRSVALVGTAACAFSLAIASAAMATERAGIRRAAVVARTRRAAPAPVRPPPPPVALQLSGLAVNIPVPRAAVIHALARDAWPALVRCVTPTPPVRGFAQVQLRQNGRVIDVVAEGPPLARRASLANCVRRAVAATVLPPTEEPPPGVSVSFDLAFNVPALGTRPTRR